jgi:cysteinyl-tRNA synthetase
MTETRGLRLYNTLSGRVEELRPADGGPVRMYSCGLTVYSRGHIGNYRTLVATDLVRRVLRLLGFGVQGVMNITDVDDRIIQLAAAAGQTIQGFTAPHIAAYFEDMQILAMETPEFIPKATDHISEMVALIERLTARGHTYESEGSIYFKIASFPRYGRLSRLDVSGIQAGARVDTDKYEKDDARDFVLWKFKSDEPAWAQWEAPFGKGRPGWHIECSAMAMKYIGETFDLHCGGIDLTFPHHENEIAQSECGTGKTFARAWMHVDHLLVEGETMSKSKGNVYNIGDLLARGFKPAHVRYMLTQAHYRKSFNFTWEGMAQVETAVARIHTFWSRLEDVLCSSAPLSGKEQEKPAPSRDDTAQLAARAMSDFTAALADDLNTPEALAAVHGLVTDGNALADRGGIGAPEARTLIECLETMDSVFPGFRPASEAALTAEEQSLLDARQASRMRRDFKAADAARAALLARGVALEDTAKGVRWKRVRVRAPGTSESPP